MEFQRIFQSESFQVRLGMYVIRVAVAFGTLGTLELHICEWEGFFIDPYSSKEKTQEELQVYLDLTSPDEPMHPRSKISFTGTRGDNRGAILL
jgi:hypothetical protein